MHAIRFIKNFSDFDYPNRGIMIERILKTLHQFKMFDEDLAHLCSIMLTSNTISDKSLRRVLDEIKLRLNQRKNFERILASCVLRFHTIDSFLTNQDLQFFFSCIQNSGLKDTNSLSIKFCILGLQTFNSNFNPASFPSSISLMADILNQMFVY